MPAIVKKNKKTGKVARERKFVVNCAIPSNDSVFDVSNFVDYLTAKIKVQKGKKAGLGKSNDVAVNKSADGNSVEVSTKIQMSKRYIKYLTKKFLKKSHIRDYVRVTANKSNAYVLTYFNVGKDEEQAQE